MSIAQKWAESLNDTIKRVEPGVVGIDRDAAMASLAISLKRIADVLEGSPTKLGLLDALFEIEVRRRS